MAPTRLDRGTGLDTHRHCLGSGGLRGLTRRMLLMQEAQLMVSVQVDNQVCQLIADIAVIVEDPVHLEKVIGIHVVRARPWGWRLTRALLLTICHAG